MKKLLGNMKYQFLAMLAVVALAVCLIPLARVNAAEYVDTIPETCEGGDVFTRNSAPDPYIVNFIGEQGINLWGIGESGTVPAGKWKKTGAVYDTEYNAVWIYTYSKIVNYNITFVDEDGTQLASIQVEEGQVPAYPGTANPTKASSETTAYDFAGWKNANGADIGPATADETYKAQFVPVNLYTITWVNEDGTALETDKGVREGDMPFYDGATPAKKEDAQTTYTFDGWTPTVERATKDATYTAKFKAGETKKYTVKWVNEDGTELKSESIAYGTTPAYDGATPEKKGDAQYSYAFDGWVSTVGADGIVPVTADVTYTAHFAQSINKYMVTWKNEDGTVLETDLDVEYGTTPVYDGETPAKIEDEKNTYTFKGWTPAVDKVTGEATYTAEYTATVKTVITPEPTPDPTPDPTGTVTPTPTPTFPPVIIVTPEPTDFITLIPTPTDKVTPTPTEKVTPTGTVNPTPTDKVTPTPEPTKEAGKVYNIIYIVDGKENKKTGNPSQYTYGVGATINKIVYKNGYEFVGWFTDAKKGKEITSISKKAKGDYTLYARFDKVPSSKNGEIEYIPHDDELPDGMDADFGKLFAKMSKYTKNSITITWQKVKGADGYDIYGSRCNSKNIQRKYQYLTTVSKKKNVYVAKNLREGTYYKYYVEAYKLVNGEKQLITRSVLIHGTTTNKKYGVAEKITVNKKKITIKVGEKVKLKGTEKSSKIIRAHRPICFESSNEKIAKVTLKKGWVKGIKPGTCKIWVYAQNGIYTECEVTVVA